MIKDVLILGNNKLYERSEEIDTHNLDSIKDIISDLHDTLMEYRRIHNAGRAIAAPQIGEMKKLIYMHIDKPVVMINPILTFEDDEMIEVLDDCMSLPNLYVKVMRHKRCRLEYTDMNNVKQVLHLEGDLSELIQHEYDHLEGILATMRAIDNKSFVMKKGCFS
ncbi:peptide deformylase [Clostridiaceae bacterium M8S5]|nr:peptide deformylase [Clostridiaceae bacterium M8S5]